MRSAERVALLAETGAYWRHSGDWKRRPFARLTSGLISDTFFDCSKIVEQPATLEKMVRALITDLELEAPTCLDAARFCGVPYGSIPIATMFALVRRARFIHLEKDSTGSFSLNRFELKQGQRVVIVEDAVTTGSSFQKARKVIEDAGGHVIKTVPCLVNRSGLDYVEGMQVFGFVSRHHFPEQKTWEEGENPYTPDGKEHLEPVRPKKDGWSKLIL